MAKISLSFEVTISDKDVEDILEQAGYVEHGWNLGGHIDRENRTFRCTVDDGESMVESACTFDDIINAMAKLAPTNENIMGDLMYLAQEGDMAGEMDAFDYDEIVQTALFGEVIYG